MSIAFGTIPDWIAGVATTGALAAATLAAKAAFRQGRYMNDQIQHEKDLEHERVQRERRSQASQVAVWIESVDSELHVYFRNGSGLPIYSVSIAFKATWLSSIRYVDYSCLGPTDQARRLGRVENDLESASAAHLVRVADMRSGGRVGLAISPDSELSKLDYSAWADLAADRVHIGLAFRDAAETPWARHPNGELTEHGMRGAAIAFLESRMDQF